MTDYKEYLEYKDSGTKWLGKIPSEWSVRKLGHVLSSLKSGDASSDDRKVSGEFPIYGATGEIGRTDSPKSEGPILLVGRVGSVGALNPIKYGSFWASDNALLLSTNQSIINFDFFTYLLLSFDFNLIKSGMGQPLITGGGLKKQRIPLPPLETQQQIVEFLDRETSHIDAGIANMESLIALLTEKRSALISEVVTRGIPGEHTEFKDSGVEWLGEIPVGWDVSQVRDFFTERKERNNVGQNANYLSLMANRGIIPYAEKGNIGNKMPEDLSKTKKIFAGDFVINSMNYGIGSFGDSAYDGVCSSVYVVLAPRPEVYDKFAYLLLSNMDVARYAQSFGKGILAHRCAIGWDILKGLGMPLPPLETQQKIVEFLAEETKHIDLAISNAKSVIHLMKEKRQTLISDAVTGKIDVRNSAQLADD